MKVLKRLKKDLYKKHANKITEIEGKIPGITGLTTTTTAVLNAVENKILNISDLFKKAEYAKISDLEKIIYYF